MTLPTGPQYVMVRPAQVEVLKGIFLPYCPGCKREELLQAVGIIGAIIMPHNIFLHSSLVKVRPLLWALPAQNVSGETWWEAAGPGCRTGVLT